MTETLFWACPRQLTSKWGCPTILDRMIKNFGKPDICFGKTDGIPKGIKTIDKDSSHNPTYIADWNNLSQFQENQFNFGFWDPPYDKDYYKGYKEIWRVCKQLAILHQLIYTRPRNAIRTHMIAITTGPNTRIRCLQIFKKKCHTIKEFNKMTPNNFTVKKFLGKTSLKLRDKSLNKTERLREALL